MTNWTSALGRGAASVIAMAWLTASCSASPTTAEAYESTEQDLANPAASEHAKGMIHTSAAIEVQVPVSAVWGLVSDFGRWDLFLTAIDSSATSGEGVGTLRFARITGTDAYVVERLERVTPAEHTLSYTMLESPMPVTRYAATMRVSPTDSGGARVEWSAKFAPMGISAGDAKAFVTGFQAQGLADLAALLEPKISVSRHLAASPEDAWAMVSDFERWDRFVPLIVASHLVQSDGVTVRMLTMAGGLPTTIERLEASDDASKTLVYSMVTGPLPVEAYLSTVRVEPEAGGSLVTWSSSYKPVGDPTVAAETLTGLYTMGLQGLETSLTH